MKKGAGVCSDMGDVIMDGCDLEGQVWWLAAFAAWIIQEVSVSTKACFL